MKSPPSSRRESKIRESDEPWDMEKSGCWPSGKRVVRRSLDSDFSQLDSRPGAFAGEGQIGVDHGQFPRFLHPDHILIMEIVGKDPAFRVVEGKVAVINDAIVTELNGLESDGRHQGPRLLAGYGWLIHGDGDVGLGYQRSDVSVPSVEGEPLESVGGFREDGAVKEHPVQTVPQRAPEDATVETLVPATGGLIEIDLMFGSADFPLTVPTSEELTLIVERAVGLNTFTDHLAPGLLDHAQSAELCDRFRELRDLR